MARVYVGTYGKYNNGSIAGAWLNLADFSTFAEFVAKCREVHKDERDPEFMIQDFEELPDGLGCSEWMSEADFNDIKAAMKDEDVAAFEVIDYSDKAIAVVGDTRPLAAELKALGGRFNPRLSCGAGWIFSKKAEGAVRELLAKSGAVATAAVEKKDEGAGFDNDIEGWLASLDERKDKDYYRKGTIAAVKLPEGWEVIGKGHIENRFCFADEGADYETYKELHADAKNMEAYFLRENLRDYDAMLEKLADKDKSVYIAASGWNNEVTIRTSQYMMDYYDAMRSDKFREMTDGERETVAAAWRFARAKFEKRLQTYLKRYGTSKLITWTYWRDA